MSIAIMQPYIFPYVGYFQLIYATDTFVFYDDVNYINRGWVNRNRILQNGKDFLFTIPCRDASQNKLINEILVTDEAKPIQKVLTNIYNSYKKAPFFNEGYAIVENVLTGAPGNPLSQVCIKSVVDICGYLDLDKTFKTSSETYTNREIKKGDRLIDICHIEGDTRYINAQGGRDIYNKEYFMAQGIDLSFLVTENYSYLQYKDPFVPYLSMIDILMFNSKEDIINKILPSFRLE